jgi:signal transduction histidine kinase
MNALLGWAGLDADASQAGPAPETRIRRIARDLVDVSERARDLEQWARSDRVPRRLDPAALLASVIESHREALPVATIDVDVRTDRDVCAGFELERAVSELVDNAISHAVSAAVTVSLTVEDDGEWVVVTVADDGPGIAEMEADVIASGTETALQHGSGLGLWLVNWIVTRYGGSFRIGTAADGSGTTATVRVPGIREDETVDEVARRPTVLFR